MAKHTLYDKVYEKHKVGELATGQDQIFVGLHLVHEVLPIPTFGTFGMNFSRWVVKLLYRTTIGKNTTKNTM